ncbi:MAG: hypothetical protein R2825_03165 [Saprospiraceae bacterium]
MKNSLSKYLLITACTLFALPMALQILSFSGNYLGGHTEKTPKPIWSLDDWLSGNFQSQSEKYLSEKYGLRTAMILLHNQYQFSFFKKTNVVSVIIGKENYLYEEGYIDAFIGSDSFDEEGVKMKVKRLNDVNNKLKEMGKKIVVARAAGKASYFSEYIPDRYFPKRKKNIIDAYKNALLNSQLNYIDFNDWFREMKDTTRYPLFSKTGIHWSEYGVTLAMDSLIKYLEKVQNVDLPDLKITSIKTNQKASNSDKDIEKSMNLIFDIENGNYAYPAFEIDTTNKDSLHVLAVGDSYYLSMYDKGFSNKVFDESQFLYYGRMVYPEKKELKEYDLMEIINKYDVFLLMCTESNLPHFPWGFHSGMYELLCKEDIDLFVQNHLEEIEEMEEKIRQDKNWYDLIVKQAETQKTSIEEELRRDALYMVEASYLK